MMRAWRRVALVVVVAAWPAIIFMATVHAQDSSNPVLQGPEQPIPYSHALHAGKLNLPCEYCHKPSRSGENLAIPQAAFCMQCHASAATDSPSIQKLAEYARSNTVIPWVRVYQLPSFVSFSHGTHLAQNVTCQQCHGPVQTFTRMYKAADISMASCVKCHQQTNAAVGCDTCHSLEK